MRAAGALTGWLMACAVGFAAAGVLVVALVVGLPVVSGVPRATGAFEGRVVFEESSGPRFVELAPGQGMVRVVWQNDVVESADLGFGNRYSFQLWPGRYTVGAEAELPAKDDDFCTMRVRIKARQTRRAIFHCTPSEGA